MTIVLNPPGAPPQVDPPLTAFPFGAHRVLLVARRITLAPTWRHHAASAPALSFFARASLCLPCYTGRLLL